MNQPKYDLSQWKTLTFTQLTSMPIEEKKILAAHIIKEGGLNDIHPKVPGWGAFENLDINNEDELNAIAHNLLATMSLEQKVGQMTPNTTPIHYAPACLKYNDFPYIAGEDPILSIPGIRFSDGPTGVVMGNKSTCFPVSMGRAAAWNIELEEKVGEVMGSESRALGANFFGGVCVNLLRHPSWGRSQETYGEDPHLLGAMGKALIRGVQNHVMACVKHYALNSMENMRYQVDVDVDERTLREIYLPHFKECIDANVAAVMAAYNKVRGDYCCENKYLLTDVLRDEWGFKGIIVSDFINGIYDGAKAVEAGLDIEMPIAGRYGENLIQLVKDGSVDESIIDKAALRIISTKLRYSQTLKGASPTVGILACKAHTTLAKQVAVESTVLLKNENALLPFDKSKLTKIAVLGRLADTVNIGEMKGSSRVYPPYVVTPLAGIKDATAPEQIQVYYSANLRDAEAELAVKEADVVVVVVGLTSDDEGEFIPHWNSGAGGDRSDLHLSTSDIQLIEQTALLHDSVVVVLQGGGAIMTEPWDASVSAIMMNWYPGMEGGSALADLLFGKANPSGKLPLTIPKRVEQLPPFNKDAHAVTYDYYHGYFEIDRSQDEASYPFGFGLSYTTFEYNEVQVRKPALDLRDELIVDVTLTNTGNRSGSEVVQLYIGSPDSTVIRHVKDLKAFAKVSIEAGSQKRVSLSCKVSDLAYWEENQGIWVVEKGVYRAYIGSSSAMKDLTILEFTVG